MFCSKVIDHLNRVGSNYVLDETVGEVLEYILVEQQAAQSHFVSYWSDASGIGQLILLLLDRSEQPLNRNEIRQRVFGVLANKFGDRANQHVTRERADGSQERAPWRFDVFKSSLSWLEMVVNVARLDEERRYRFTVPLFRQWLRRRQRHENLLEQVVEKIGRDMDSDGLEQT